MASAPAQQRRGHPGVAEDAGLVTAAQVFHDDDAVAFVGLLNRWKSSAPPDGQVHTSSRQVTRTTLPSEVRTAAAALPLRASSVRPTWSAATPGIPN